MDVKELASRWAWAALLLARVPPACEVDRMHVSCRACVADCSHASHQACTADFSRSSRLIKQLHTRHWVWLNIDTVHIIQPFVILTCQLIVSERTSLATNVRASSQNGRFFYHDIYVPCHEIMPSFMFFGWVFDLLGFKNRDSQCFRRRQVCNSFPFLKWDLNMHPMTHVQFPTHFVLVVQI